MPHSKSLCVFPIWVLSALPILIIRYLPNCVISLAIIVNRDSLIGVVTILVGFRGIGMSIAIFLSVMASFCLRCWALLLWCFVFYVLTSFRFYFDQVYDCVLSFRSHTWYRYSILSYFLTCIDFSSMILGMVSGRSNPL